MNFIYAHHKYPVSTEGRAIEVILMMAGVPYSKDPRQNYIANLKDDVYRSAHAAR
jgi:hypothetical protein